MKKKRKGALKGNCEEGASKKRNPACFDRCMERFSKRTHEVVGGKGGEGGLEKKKKDVGKKKKKDMSDGGKPCHRPTREEGEECMQKVGAPGLGWLQKAYNALLLEVREFSSASKEVKKSPDCNIHEQNRGGQK